MNKFIAIVMTLVLIAALMAGCSAENKAPESIQFAVTAHLLAGAGDTFDAASALEVNGENVNQEVAYSTSDESVATVSPEGVVTAAGAGSATITAASVVDGAVAASMDIAVYDFRGTYSGEKYIDAMSCDIAVDITLNADGTFGYYRAPMVIDMEGGGEMPEITDGGTYVMEGTEITFTAEELGEFSLAFSIADGTASISGKVPTGGPSTEMTLTLKVA